MQQSSGQPCGDGQQALLFKLPPGFAPESKAVPALAAAPLLVSPSRPPQVRFRREELIPQNGSQPSAQSTPRPPSPKRDPNKGLTQPPPFPGGPPPPNMLPPNSVTNAKDQMKEPYIYISENGQIFKVDARGRRVAMKMNSRSRILVSSL